MEQINFRIKADEKKILQFIAEERSISIAELARSAVLKEIGPIRIDLAFQLLTDRKIGRKKAWILSGLSYHEFLIEWTKRGAEEFVPQEILEKESEILNSIDIKKLLK
jgi:hypothetical protein